jgi:hypothetical protein
VIMILSFEVLVYHVLLSMSMSHYWQVVIALVGIIAIDISIGATDFGQNSFGWLITLLTIGLAEIYIAYYNELTKRRNFEKEFEYKVSDTIFKELLTISSDGFLLFEKKKNVRYCNEALLSMLGKFNSNASDIKMLSNLPLDLI